MTLPFLDAYDHEHAPTFVGACDNGDITTVTTLLPLMNDVVVRDGLCCACQNNHLPVVDYLMTHHPVDIQPVIPYCFKEGYRGDIMRLLVSSGRIDINYKNQTFLRRACLAGDLDTVQWLLNRPEPSHVGSVLYTACANGQTAIVAYLLTLSAPDTECLRIACEQGHLDVVRQLLAHLPPDAANTLKGDIFQRVCEQSVSLGNVVFQDEVLPWAHHREMLTYLMTSPDVAVHSVFDDFKPLSEWPRYFGMDYVYTLLSLLPKDVAPTVMNHHGHMVYEWYLRDGKLPLPDNLSASIPTTKEIHIYQ